MKNCLEEYLTEKCHTCPFWSDGSDKTCVGCCIPASIMECKYFAKMYYEENKI